MIDFKKYHLTIKNSTAQKLIKIFLHIAFFICVISIAILLVYNFYFSSIYLYKASIIIFRTGILTGIFSIICGIFFSNYEYLNKM